MDGNMTFNLTELILQVIEQYGAAGFAMGFGIYYIFILQKKLDKLTETTNKMFGAVSAFANKYFEEKRGPGNND